MQDGGQRKRKMKARVRGLYIFLLMKSCANWGEWEFELLQDVLLSFSSIIQDKTHSYYQMFEGQMVYILATTKCEEK